MRWHFLGTWSGRYETSTSNVHNPNQDVHGVSQILLFVFYWI